MRRWLSRNLFYPLACAYDGEPEVPRLQARARALTRMRPEQLEERQLRRLRELLAFAERHSPFHGRRFAEYGIRASDIRSLADLARLPLTTKDDIRAHSREMLVPGADVVKTSTGGSTASPLTFYRDRACHHYRHAGTWEANRWVRWRPGDPWALVWGAARDRGAAPTWKARLRDRLVDRQRVLDVSGATADEMRAFLADLRRDPPDIIYGYTNALYELTNLAISMGPRMPAPRALMATAEPLVPHEKRLVEEFWGAPLYDRYACREFGVVASECPDRCGLHVLTDSVVVEVVKPQGAGPEDPGEVVITDLMNRGMPFIRYPMGDASRHLGASRCSLPYPLLAPVTGRASEYLISPEGRYVSGTGIIFDVLGGRTAVTGMQLVQETRSLLVVRVVPGPGYGEAEREDIRRRLAKYLGSMEVTFEEVPEIAREASGKLRFTICKVPAEWARRGAPGPPAGP